MEVIPGGCVSILNTAYNFITSKFLIRSDDPQVFIFTVTKMLENIVCAQKLENKLQIAKKLILRCDFSNAWV